MVEHYQPLNCRGAVFWEIIVFAIIGNLQVNLTQCDQAKQESQQKQGEEEQTEQPLPPGATGIRAAAESSTSEDTTVPANL